MINTYVDNTSEYIIQFTYHSLITQSINTNISAPSTKVVIQQTSLVKDDFIKISPQIGINFSIYPTVKVQ